MNVLFHIGLAKSGSTYLQHWFAQHPDMVRMDQLFPIINRGRWRLQGNPKLTVLSDECFASWIKHEPGWGKRIDPSHEIRDYQLRTCDFLYALCPHASVLLVTRASNEHLVRSIYSQYVKTGGGLSLDDFFELAQELLRAAFDYNHLLRIYEEKFGPERLLVLPYELMCDNQDAFLEAIEGHFGLSRFRLDGGRVNRSVSHAEMLLYLPLNRLMAATVGHLLGYRAFPLYLKLLRHNLLLPVAKLYALVRPGAMQQLDGAARHAEALRPAATRLLERPFYASYRERYAPGSQES